MPNPPDEYILQELKEIFKSGEFIPYNPKNYANRQEKSTSEEADGIGVKSPLAELKKNLEEEGYGAYDYEAEPEVLKKDKERAIGEEDRSSAFTIVDDPEFYFDMKLPKEIADSERPFAVPPVDPRYFRKVPQKAGK